MNTQIISFILGHVLRIEAALMCFPILVALVYREQCGLWFVAVAAVCLITGYLLLRRKPESNVFYLKEGCIATALSWVFMSFFGCMPFYLSGQIPKFTDAFFETVSGFTTTGSSILPNVEALARCMLFWRSFTHWIGGMGVLVFLLAILPMTGGSNMNLMRAESPGMVVGKLVPRVRYTARILYYIYMVLTVIELIFLLAGKMPMFDALCITLGTAGTGGFGVLNSGCADYTAYQQWVITIFMLIFAVNFNAYFLIIFGKAKKAFSMEEVRVYWGIVVVAIAFVFAYTYIPGMKIEPALRAASFQVASLISSTGYATVDFNLWTAPAKMMLILVMFVGACGGSTGGGLKVSRIITALKAIKKELGLYIYPKRVQNIKMDDKSVGSETVHATYVYFLTFTLIFGCSLFVVSLNGYDFETNFSAVLTTLNNMGPGFNAVGPTMNFSHMSVLTKYVLIFDMLAGRLELYPMLLLCMPSIWKEYQKSMRK